MRRRIDTGRSGGIRFSLEPINGGFDKSTNNTDNTVRCSEVNSFLFILDLFLAQFSLICHISFVAITFHELLSKQVETKLHFSYSDDVISAP